MGCIFSRCCCCSPCCKTDDLERRKYSSNDTQTVIDSAGGSPGCVKKYSWDLRPKLNPQDYIISDVYSDQRVKRPGEVKGQQFIIRNCHDAKIYLFDYMSTVTIDDCSDCLIVIGTVQGSVFIRDTKNSTILCASSQLRLRDCKNIHLFVGCESDPIIEASSEVTVGPYFLSYNGLEEHFKSAKLCRFKTTHWSEIYDFTPNDLSSNWNRYDENKHDPEKFVCFPQPDYKYCDLGISVREELSFIPVTHFIDSCFHIGDSISGGISRHRWQKQEVTFTLEPGQDTRVLEFSMGKYYRDKFLKDFTSERTAILGGIESNRSSYTFYYYTVF